MVCYHSPTVRCETTILEGCIVYSQTIQPGTITYPFSFPSSSLFFSIFLGIHTQFSSNNPLSIYLSIYLSTYLIYPSIYLSIFLSTYLSIYLSIYPSTYLSNYLSIYLSTYFIFTHLVLKGFSRFENKRLQQASIRATPCQNACVWPLLAGRMTRVAQENLACQVIVAITPDNGHVVQGLAFD